MTPTFHATFSRRRRAGQIALCAALLLPLLAAAKAPGVAPTPEAAQTFHPTLSYLLRIDGQVAPEGKFYASEHDDLYLILSRQLSGPVLLDLHAQTVATLAPLPAARADGTLVVPAGTARKPQGQFEVQGSSPAFTVEGRKVRLEYPAPLLGLQGVAAIRAYNPEYDRRAAAYHPDPAALARLAAVQQPVRLRVYFATWCPVCSRALPKLIKVLDGLKGKPFAVEYYGLSEDRNADPEPARMNLQGLPTAVVYRQGKEVGRMTGQQWQQPEVALDALLAPAR
ncbi:MAG TPA: thioredoxin family protein [Thermoanaerobaculia bacterium]|nr:thioredoxin family protein [Thermoanaerobaculia bacterium]